MNLPLLRKAQPFPRLARATAVVALLVLVAFIPIPVRAQFWQPDATFTPRLAGPTPTTGPSISDVALQPDGKLLATGSVEVVNGQSRAQPRAPLRFNPDGALDPSFQANEPASRLHLQPSGQVVTEAGVRLNADGRRDTSFPSFPDPPSVAAVDPLGRLYWLARDAKLLRTTADGIDDGSFRGTVTPLSAGIAPFADGSVAITARKPEGGYEQLLVSYRLGPDGAADSRFAPYIDLIQALDFLGLVPLPDGRVLLYGTTSAQSGIALRFVRLGLDGTPDYTYIAPGSGASTPGPAEAFTLAGVLYDLLRDAHPPAGTRVRARFSTGAFAAAIDVGLDGSLYLGNTGDHSPGDLARYLRSSPTQLTIDPTPTLLFGSSSRPLNLLLGQPTRLYAPASGGLFPLTYQWQKDGVPIPGATASSWKLPAATAADAGVYSVVISNAYGSITSGTTVIAIDTTPAPLSVTTPLKDRVVPAGSALDWWVYAKANPYPTFTWTHNGAPMDAVTGGGSSQAAASSVQIASVQPEHTGIYEATVTSGESSRHMTGILGVLSDQKTAGSATEVGPDIVHPNKNVYDQVLLTGPAAAITADPIQVTRLSFVDLTNDIVQVELSGTGTLALVLDNAGSPSPPVNYNQPDVSYVRGHPGIVVAGADETTHVAIFSVGRANAVNQALFRGDVNYDGMADVAFLAISSTNGRFGSLRAGNVQFYGHRGLTGLYAPGVVFTGPVYVGNIDAFDTATPVLVLDGAADLRITGGDLHQTNGQPVRIGQLLPRNFTAGTTSHGDPLPAQPNRATFAPMDGP